MIYPEMCWRYKKRGKKHCWKCQRNDVSWPDKTEEDIKLDMEEE